MAPLNRLVAGSWRIARWSLIATASLLGLVVVSLVALQLALRLPSVQNELSTRVSRLLSSVLDARVEVKVGPTSLLGATQLDASAYSEKAQESVLVLRGVTARVATGELLWSLIAEPRLVVRVEHLAIEDAEVSLRSTEESGLLLAQALSPPPAEPAAAPSEDQTGGPLVLIESIAIEHLEVWRARSMQRPLATLGDVHGEFSFDESIRVRARSDELELNVPERDLVLVGKLTAEVEVAEDTPRVVAMIEGLVGGVELRASGQLEGEQWSATASANGAPSAWRELELGISPRDPVAVELDARGDFYRAQVTVDGSSGTMETDVTGSVVFSPLRVEGRLEVEHANPRIISPDLAEADVNLHGRFDLQVEPSLQLSATLQTEVGEVAGERLPALVISAKSANARSLEFDLRSVPETSRELSVEGRVERLEKSVKFAIRVEADGLPQTSLGRRLQSLRVDDIELKLEGEYEPSSRRLRGSIDANVRRLVWSRPAIDAREIVIDAGVEGTVQQPEVSASVRAGHLGLPGVRLDSLRLRVRPGRDGSVVSLATKARIDDAEGPTLRLRLTTALSSLWPLELRGGRLRIAKGENEVSGEFAAVRVGERMSLKGLSLRGVGGLSVDATIDGGSVQAKVRSRDLQLASLTALLAPMVPHLSGAVTVDGEAELVGGRLRAGRLHGKATAFQAGSFEMDHVAASLVVERQYLSGSALAFRGASWVRLDVGEASLSALTGHPNGRAEPWVAGLEGTASLTASVSSDDLARMTAKLTPDVHWTGQLGIDGRLQKTSAGALAGSWLVRGRQLGVRHLAVDDEQSRQRAEEDGVVTQGWLMRDLTFDWAAKYDGATGVFSNALRIGDPERQKQMLGASVAATIAPEDLLAGNVEAIERAPLRGALEIPRMSLSSIPMGLIPTGVEAMVAANVRVAGSVVDPELSGFVELDDFSVQSLHRSLPVKLRVEGRYADSGIAALARVLREGELVAEASVEGEIAAGKISYAAEAKLHSIPVGCFPYVRDYGVTGVIGGSIGLRDGDGGQVLKGRIVGRRLSVFDVDIPRLDVSVDFEDGSLVSRVDVRESRGSLQAKLSARSSDGTLSALEAKRLHVVARDFEIEPLLTLVRDPVQDLSGIVNADVHVQLDSQPPRARGELVLENGNVHVQALGQHFRDVGFRLVASPGRVQLTNLRALSAGGRIDGDGQAQYDRDGLLSGWAKLRIARKHALPILRQGRTIAHASGRIDLVASRSPTRSLEVGVEVPQLDVRLAEESPQTLQELELPEYITLGAVGPDGRFVPIDVARESDSDRAGKPVEIDVHLGDDVWVHRGPGVFASLEGDVTVLLDEDVRLYGELRSQQGQIEVAGRVFRVRRGTIALTGSSPPDPDVVAEAEWEAPSGYTVVASFRGPVSTGELTLRSEPPLSQGQILNVLLFDSPEGAVTEEGSGGSAASSVAASIAGAGMSRALSDLTNLEVSAAVDTSVEGAPRPEVGVRLNPRLSVGVSYAPNPTPSLGRPPDRGVVSLDWRVSRRWTLESTFGDSGSASTDLVWRLRY